MDYKNYESDNYLIDEYDKSVINEGIETLRKNGIFSDIEVFDERFFYTLCIIDRSDSLRVEVISKVAYELRLKHRKRLSKNIQMNYLYEYYENDKAIENALSQKRLIRLTSFFPLAIQRHNEYHEIETVSI